MDLEVLDEEGGEACAETRFIGWNVILGLQRVEYNKVPQETGDEGWETGWKWETVHLVLRLYSVYASPWYILLLCVYGTWC